MTDKNYELFFELCGKKMKTTVLASSADHAKVILMNKIVFHKIKLADDDFNSALKTMDDLMNMFGMKR